VLADPSIVLPIWLNTVAATTLPQPMNTRMKVPMTSPTIPERSVGSGSPSPARTTGGASEVVAAMRSSRPAGTSSMPALFTDRRGCVEVPG